MKWNTGQSTDALISGTTVLVVKCAIYVPCIIDIYVIIPFARTYRGAYNLEGTVIYTNT